MNDDPPYTAPTQQEKWVDLDPPLRNSDRLVVVFSQCRWDGRITFAIHREFERYDHESGETHTLKTSFVPEGLTASYASILALALEHIEKLKVDRVAGKLPYPEGGVESEPRRRRRPAE